jgi:hypothetical protein
MRARWTRRRGCVLERAHDCKRVHSWVESTIGDARLLMSPSIAYNQDISKTI